MSDGYSDEFMAWLGQSGLTERNKAAVLLRSQGMTLREAGKMLGVGPERIRQMCWRAKRGFGARHKVAENRARLNAAANERREHWDGMRSAPWASWTADCVELGARAANVMRNEGWTLGQVARATDAEILRIPNCGRKTLRELREAVAEIMEPLTPESP